MPTIHCPFCNKSFDVDPEKIGQDVQCAFCNQSFSAVMPEENSSGEATRTAPPQQPFMQQPQYPQTGYPGVPQGYPPPGYNVPPQGYPPPGYNVPPQGYPPPGYNVPPQGYPPPGYNVPPQGYPPPGYNVPPQGYPPPGYNVPPQGYPPQGVPPGYMPPGSEMPQQGASPEENNRKSGIVYVILGLFLGNFGIHDFYAEHKVRGFIHLGLFFVPLVLAVGFIVSTGDYKLDNFIFFFVCQVINAIWSLAEIIAVNKDGNGVPMK